MNTKRKILPILLFLAVGAAIISGCTDGEKSAFHNISPKGWTYGDTLYFFIPDYTSDIIESNTYTPLNGSLTDGTAVSDSTSSEKTAPLLTGDMILVVRHSNAYEYSNIWLNIRYSARDTVVNDTLNICLADDFGNWYGKGMGVSYQFTDTVARDVTLDTSSPVKVWHIMRADTLPDIEQIGIIFK